MLRKEFMECFERLFAQQYETIHRLETNKLRNVAKVGKCYSFLLAASVPHLNKPYKLHLVLFSSATCYMMRVLRQM